MGETTAQNQDVKPSDKYARSDQAPPPGKRRVPQFLSDIEEEDAIETASEDSFPASDPPAVTIRDRESSLSEGA
jgi:hypothetical protein